MKRLRMIRAILVGLALSFTTQSAWAACEHQLFTITAESGTVSGGELIGEMAKECRFSIVVKDEEAQKILDRKLSSVYLNNISLSDLFGYALSENGLHYDYDGRVLKVRYLITRTFKINYVGTERSGEGSTDITVTGGGNDSGSDSTTTTSTTNNSNSNSKSGESKTQIRTKDEYNFWNTIKAELEGVLQRPEDTFKNTAMVMNKGAGLVTVTGTQEQIRRVEGYIENMSTQLQKQVLIDVNILTVTHTKGSSTGVNWKKFGSQFSGGVGENSGVWQIGQIKDTTQAATYDTDAFSMLNWSGAISLDAVVDFLRTYGDVSAVSNPKVLTLNNQPALISVGDIFYYKEQTDSIPTGDSTGEKTSEITYKSQFAGVLLDITPSVHNEEVMLKINPSVSKITGEKLDANAPPNLTTNQLSSVIRLKSGNRAILGGLITKSNTTDDTKVPLLGDIPLLGYAFRNTTQSQETQEMIIVITPHIIDHTTPVSLKELGYAQLSHEPL